VIRIKSIFWKLFITYIVILIVSHVVLMIVSYLLFQNHLTTMHLHTDDFNQMKYSFVLASMISIAITGLFTYYLSKKMTAPIRQMNRAALHIAKGRFDRRVKVKTNDELGQLGDTFNYMIQQLASLDQMKKDFVVNVSHDLRSPLTSIHGFVGAFLDDTIKN
jgi:signal transduction histidine kinase